MFDLTNAERDEDGRVKVRAGRYGDGVLLLDCPSVTGDYAVLLNGQSFWTSFPVTYLTPILRKPDREVRECEVNVHGVTFLAVPVAFMCGIPYEVDHTAAIVAELDRVKIEMNKSGMLVASCMVRNRIAELKGLSHDGQADS